MPSFLSKVFGRKKEDVVEAPTSPKGHKSNPSLLEGKFEAVVTPASPTAINFAEAQGQSKDKEGGFALFKTKSRPSNLPLSPTKQAEELPTLSLNLPGQKEENGTRALGVVFEGDRHVALDDSAIGAKRLSPVETLALVRACSQAITERGLETLGIMHPHWHSASPEIQRRLISIFVQSLAKDSASSPTAFESELKFTRSPHDVAAVLRWGLRHLKLDGKSFGKDSIEWSWYKEFSEWERSSQYPPKAFSGKLVPLLPKHHLDLLLATLEIESSLAAHAEHNSISGSKLSKFLGLWLLTASRSEPSDDWDAFYARWERAGRILEHLFLCRIRDESVNHRMPTRLMELVNQYPYFKGPTSPDQEFLPRPRFSTRPYEALFVRIDTELPNSTAERPKRDRLRLLAEAFKLDSPTDGGEYAVVWDKVKQAAAESSDTEDSSTPKNSPVLNRVFADETIRLLSLIPADGTDSPINLISPTVAAPATTHRRSSSLSRIPDHKGTNGLATPNANDNSTTLQPKAAATPPPPSPAIDWASFSTAGFGEASTVSQHLSATLLDQDIEMTDPSVTRKLSRPKRNRDTSRRSSADNPNLVKANGTSPQKVSSLAVSKATHVTTIQLDEAFVDFWSDAAIDPVSSSWPTFVICKLNAIPGVQSHEGKPINWLVIEQTYSTPRVPRSTSPTSPTKRASSPKPSVRSDMSRVNSTLSATRKRFSFFGGSSAVSPVKVDKTTGPRTKTSPKEVKTGELEKILPATEEKSESKTNTASVQGAEVKEPAAVSSSKDAETVISTKLVDKVDPPVASDVEVERVKAAAIASAVPVVEKYVPEPSQTLQHIAAAPTETLPPAPEGVVLSGNTPGPQVALGTREPITATQAKLSAITAEPASTPVEETPGPQVASDTEPAKIESLKVEEETSLVLPPIQEIPVVPIVTDPILTEDTHAPEPMVEAKPVELTLPSQVADVPASIEPVPDVAPELVEEPEVDAEEPLGLANETVPEPTKEVPSEPIVEPEVEPPVEPPVETVTEPVTIANGAAAEHIEEPHLKPGPAVPEASQEEVHESELTSVESPEPPTEASVADAASAEPISKSEELETAIEHVAPQVEPKLDEEIRDGEPYGSHISEETS